MTLDKLRIYYNAIIGGLLGWALISVLLRFSTESTGMLFLKDALLGALVGSTGDLLSRVMGSAIMKRSYALPTEAGMHLIPDLTS